MRLADEIRRLKKRIEDGDDVMASLPNIIERAEIMESLFEESHAALTKANIPVAEPVCSITLTDGGWYEWILPKRKCDYGYYTWREAHQAARVVLTEAERDHYRGRVTGAVLYLNALAMALGSGTIIGVKLKRVVKLLEEEG